MKTFIQNITRKIKQKICRHDYGAPEIVYDSPDYARGSIKHPVDGNNIPVLKREFRVLRRCKKCGHVHTEKGYNSLPLPEENLTVSEQAEIIQHRKRQAEKGNEKVTRFKNKFREKN
jgi:hypothetical protein